MADIKSPDDRSRNMAMIRSRDTKPEIWLRKRLYALGYRYRKNTIAVFRHPDLWLKKYNTAVFVHGCFWHRHTGCKYAYSPKTRAEFWNGKFNKNLERDRIVVKELRNTGIRVLIIWECTVKKVIKSGEEEKRVIGEIEHFLKSDKEYLEL